MEAYKFNTRVSDTGIIKLPFEPALFNREVELIVLPETEEKKPFSKTPKSMKGVLKAYANPALIEHEKFAWETNVKEKYGAV
jgi:hypothetical protein